MYIRWVTRKHKSPLSATVVFHDAYLVESYRDERGSPRQRSVCYLGNLRQIDDRIPHIESELFLARAGRVLHAVAANEPVDPDTVLADLRTQLPSFTPDAALQTFADQVSWFYEWWSQHGTSSAEDEIFRVVDSIVGLRERTT